MKSRDRRALDFIRIILSFSSSPDFNKKMSEFVTYVSIWCHGGDHSKWSNCFLPLGLIPELHMFFFQILLENKETAVKLRCFLQVCVGTWRSSSLETTCRCCDHLNKDMIKAEKNNDNEIKMKIQELHEIQRYYISEVWKHHKIHNDIPLHDTADFQPRCPQIFKKLDLSFAGNHSERWVPASLLLQTNDVCWLRWFPEFLSVDLDVELLHSVGSIILFAKIMFSILASEDVQTNCFFNVNGWELRKAILGPLRLATIFG